MEPTNNSTNFYTNCDNLSNALVDAAIDYIDYSKLPQKFFAKFVDNRQFKRNTMDLNRAHNTLRIVQVLNVPPFDDDFMVKRDKALLLLTHGLLHSMSYRFICRALAKMIDLKGYPFPLDITSISEKVFRSDDALIQVLNLVCYDLRDRESAAKRIVKEDLKIHLADDRKFTGTINNKAIDRLCTAEPSILTKFLEEVPMTLYCLGDDEKSSIKLLPKDILNKIIIEYVIPDLKVLLIQKIMDAAFKPKYFWQKKKKPEIA